MDPELGQEVVPYQTIPDTPLPDTPLPDTPLPDTPLSEQDDKNSILHAVKAEIRAEEEAKRTELAERHQKCCPHCYLIGFKIFLAVVVIPLLIIISIIMWVLWILLLPTTCLCPCCDICAAIVRFLWKILSEVPVVLAAWVCEGRDKDDDKYQIPRKKHRKRKGHRSKHNNYASLNSVSSVAMETHLLPNQTSDDGLVEPRRVTWMENEHNGAVHRIKHEALTPQPLPSQMPPGRDVTSVAQKQETSPPPPPKSVASLPPAAPPLPQNPPQTVSQAASQKPEEKPSSESAAALSRGAGYTNDLIGLESSGGTRHRADLDLEPLVEADDEVEEDLLYIE